MRTWQPGDVAMVTAYNHPKEYRAFFDGKTWRKCDGPMFCVDRPTSIRHLAVIDSEDEGAVLLLTGCLAVHGANPNDRNYFPETQAALREFADPKPIKPAEPMGLGAVVEDTGGGRWVRLHPGGEAWINRYETTAMWQHIDVVTVLSVGIS